MLIVGSFQIFGQQPFTKDFMPNVGDTVFYKTRMQVTDDFTLTGEDYVWDFSLLTGFTWAADTFVSVISTPLVYNVAFNNPLTPSYQASVASPKADIVIPPSTSITNVYYYFKETNTYYAQVGLAANVSGAPIPIKYDNIDFIYRFPSNMNDVDSCFSSYKISIPTLGEYSHKQTRVNSYDGWGTLYTAVDTFQVLRIKTIINARDSVFVTQNGMNLPFAFNTLTTEYKWFSPSIRNSVFEASIVVGQGPASKSIKYRDHPRNYVAISEVEKINFEVFPNPFINIITIVSKSDIQVESIKMYTITGAVVPVKITPSSDRWEIDAEILTPSSYVLEIKTNKGVERKIIVK